MTSWTRELPGALPVYQANPISQLPWISQGFTTRQGGLSLPPYDSFNLGSKVGDLRQSVQANRQRLWDQFDVSEAQVAWAQQVHGNHVAIVTEGGISPQADALITATPDVFLMLLFADCVPIYIVDPIRQVIALIHAGWRGTASNIVASAIDVLESQFNSTPRDCLAAIGPSIQGDSYEVGPEVAAEFKGYPKSVHWQSCNPGKHHIDLRHAIFQQFLQQGFQAESIALCSEDTFGNQNDFYSYRRDNGTTGRMAAFMMLNK